MKKIVLTLLMALGISQSAFAGVHEGVEAYKRGDYAKALHEWKPAAEQGHGEAQFRLGLMYAYGKGVHMYPKQAVPWFRKSADQGNSDGQHYMGEAYFLGAGVQRDYKQALYWYRLAAEQGNPNSQLSLGIMNGTARGVPQNLPKAYMWFDEVDPVVWTAMRSS